MKKETTVTKGKSPVITDNRLAKQNDVILFPRKVEEAKRRIVKYGLPDAVKKN